MGFTRRDLCALAAGSLLSFAAVADSYPSRPIKLLVPYPPGGAIDVFARIIADQLTARNKWVIVVENRGGGAGSLGMEQAAKAPADGYTIVMGLSSNLAVGPHLYKKLAYDPIKDFTPITTMAISPMVLLTAPGSPLKTLGDALSAARRKPGTITFASPGNGSVAHLTGELLQSATGVKLTHVPYRGSVQAMSDLAGGHVDLFMSSIATASQLIETGKVVPIGVTGATRYPTLPQVPTIAEQGHANFNAAAWWGLLAPTGTPKAVVDTWNREVNQILKVPKVREQVMAQGAEVLGGTTQEFQAFLAAEYDKWGKIVRDAAVALD